MGLMVKQQCSDIVAEELLSGLYSEVGGLVIISFQHRERIDHVCLHHELQVLGKH